MWLSSPVNVARGASRLRCEFDASALTDPEMRAEVSIEISEDGGRTWEFFASATRKGGVVTDSAGRLISISSVHGGRCVYPDGKTEQPVVFPAGTRARVWVIAPVPIPARLQSGHLTPAGFVVLKDSPWQ